MGGTCGGLFEDAFSRCIPLCTQSFSETCPNEVSISQKGELCQGIIYFWRKMGVGVWGVLVVAVSFWLRLYVLARIYFTLTDDYLNLNPPPICGTIAIFWEVYIHLLRLYTISRSIRSGWFIQPRGSFVPHGGRVPGVKVACDLILLPFTEAGWNPLWEVS